MRWLLLIPLVPYLFILLKIYRNLSKINKFSYGINPGVKVSVIIPCKNESSRIGNILQDLAGQNYPENEFEVIVVDDNSTDNTTGIATAFKGISHFQILRNKHEGKKMAIRTGTEAATGELIITTDADCRAGKKWVSSVASFYNMYKPDLIICPVSLESGHSFPGKFQELEFLALQGITAGSAAGNKSTMCNGANLAFRRSTYHNHSANLQYDINSGDDIFLLQSIKKEEGSDIRWLESEDSMVTTSKADTLSGFLAQRKRWISKISAYSDRFTVLLGIVTFVTIISEIALLISSLFNIGYLFPYIIFFVLKSVPDFLILKNTATRYHKKELMKWFLPSRLIYPFYVLLVVSYPVVATAGKIISSPFRKGI
jgi:biofilm PGA synthesis N-glycosyltransferase PgaC